MTKIVRLEIENVKRIRAAAIEPDGSVVVVGGKNSAGKSSAIDAIAYALGGKALVPDEPLRRGEERGTVKVDLGDYTVERVFTPTNSRLVVRNAEGFKAPGPQALLDRIVGDMRLGFDPMAFLRKGKAEQLEVLKRLVGVDCSDLDERRRAAYADRTAANREVKALKARLDAAPFHDDAPELPVSVNELMAELDRRREANQRNYDQREALADMKAHGVKLRKEIDDLKNRIADLQSDLAERTACLAGVRKEYGRREEEVAALRDAHLIEVRARIDASEEINRRVRENANRAKLAESLCEFERDAAELTDKIDAADRLKAERLAAAEFPVDGLSFDEAGVTLDGLPFEQAGQADQIRVAVAIAFASGSDLRIALVRDGSLLDDDSLALLHRFADEQDGQVWLERVGAGPEVTVLIEDGAVAEVRDA